MMSTNPPVPTPLSPLELRKLPQDERESILSAQAELAAPLYRSLTELSEFEAFSEDDLHVDSSDTETR